jgi:hypothetical protein
MTSNHAPAMANSTSEWQDCASLPNLFDRGIIDPRSHPTMTTSQTTPSSRIYHRHEDVVCRLVGHESILVPIRPSTTGIDSVYTLSPVGNRVWELLDGHATVDEIVRAICSEYEVEETVARADIDELLAALEGASLVARH